jgi:hypothetical protein
MDNELETIISRIIDTQERMVSQMDNMLKVMDTMIDQINNLQNVKLNNE